MKPSLSRISFRYGWLLYVGTMGGGPESGLAVSGDVMDVNVTMESGAVSVSSISSPHLAYVPGPPEITVNARMSGPGAKMIRGQAEDTALWHALRSWNEPGPGCEGRRWPPQLRAMAELARRHPGEYRDLVAAETRSEPLQVVRHSWLDSG